MFMKTAKMVQDCLSLQLQGTQPQLPSGLRGSCMPLHILTNTSLFCLFICVEMYHIYPPVSITCQSVENIRKYELDIENTILVTDL